MIRGEWGMRMHNMNTGRERGSEMREENHQKVHRMSQNSCNVGFDFVLSCLLAFAFAYAFRLWRGVSQLTTRELLFVRDFDCF